MKIADAVIAMMCLESTDKNWGIVPFDRHDLCCKILKKSGKEPKTGDNKYIMNSGRYHDCKRVADALERDPRFEKFLVNHGIRRRFFRYRGEGENCCD